MECRLIRTRASLVNPRHARLQGEPNHRKRLLLEGRGDLYKSWRFMTPALSCAGHIRLLPHDLCDQSCITLFFSACQRVPNEGHNS